MKLDLRAEGPIRTVPALDPNDDQLMTRVGIAEGDADSAIGEGRPSIRSANSPGDAVSGLGGDIVKRLEGGDVLVVWLFDASLSMRGDHQLASKQMVKVFRELDDRIQQISYRPRQSLMYFGQGSGQLIEPTARWIRVTRQTAKIPDDVSGVENVFTALHYAIPEYRKKWDRALMFVVWTDESGNDDERLEETIRFCQQHKVSVSVVGPTAVMGRTTGLQYFELNRQHRWWLQVDKGPDARRAPTRPVPALELTQSQQHAVGIRPFCAGAVKPGNGRQLHVL